MCFIRYFALKVVFKIWCLRIFTITVITPIIDVSQRPTLSSLDNLFAEHLSRKGSEGRGDRLTRTTVVA